MKKSLIIILFFISFLTGCSNKNYQCIETIKTDYNNKSENNNIIVTHKNFNPSKKIFNKLGNDISDDFIYIFSWVNHLPSSTNHFQCLIYDRKSKKCLCISNTVNDSKAFNVDNDTMEFEAEKLILNYFFENNINTLVLMPKAFSSSGIGPEYYLFDSASKEAYVIENLVLDGESIFH
ncbi:hypothetical protein [Flavobacterium rivuli]|nr:hypothetical protein [Flavobacterium rivuli]